MERITNMDASDTRSERKKKKKTLQRENTITQKNKKLPNVWFSLKKSLHCKSDTSDVHDPRSTKRTTSTSFGVRSGCSRSIANLKDVIHGNTRHLDKPTCSSPRSIGSNEFLNPITHQVILSNSTSELKITAAGDMNSPVNQLASYRSQASRKAPLAVAYGEKEGLRSEPRRRASQERDSVINGSNSPVSCHKCSERFSNLEAKEAHHLTKHAVTELVEGDSSRKIVEIICRTSGLKSENQWGRIDRILKVHNRHKTLARFEEYDKFELI